MNKPNHFILLVVLLVASACSSIAPEPMVTHTQSFGITSTPLPPSMPKPTKTVKVNPTASEIQSGKIECEVKGHTTTWSLGINWLETYVGSIDEKSTSIGMTLVYSGNSIGGVYFYADKSDEMKIKGCLEKDRDFILYVYDENDKRLAIIHGQFPEIDPLGGYNGGKLERDVIIGTWVSELTAEEHSIYLRLHHAVAGTLEHQYKVAGVTDDKIIDEAAQEFLNAVASIDKEFVAGMIEYPIWITFSGNRTELKNQDEFIAYYQEIFTDEFMAKLALMIPKHMFAKYTGIMLGQGQIWFNANGKVIAIFNGGG